jgi:hypothetical protein
VKTMTLIKNTVNTMNGNLVLQNAPASRRLPLACVGYANSLTGLGFGGTAAGGFVSTSGQDVQTVVGTIGTWRSTAPQGQHVSMPFAPGTNQLVNRTHASIETSPAELVAAKRVRTFGLAKAAKDADRGVEGTARRGVPD